MSEVLRSEQFRPSLASELLSVVRVHRLLLNLMW
jgi:hypothetical protein